VKIADLKAELEKWKSKYKEWGSQDYSAAFEIDRLKAENEKLREEIKEARELVNYAEGQGFARREAEHANDRRLLDSYRQKNCEQHKELERLRAELEKIKKENEKVFEIGLEQSRNEGALIMKLKAWTASYEKLQQHADALAKALELHGQGWPAVERILTAYKAFREGKGGA